MTFATAVSISFTSFVYSLNVYWSVIHGIKRKPHLSVVWNWYHFVAIAILHQPRPTDSADINTRLQLSDTSSIPPMHGGFLLTYIHTYIHTYIWMEQYHSHMDWIFIGLDWKRGHGFYSYLSQFLQFLVMFWNTIITTYVSNLKEIHRKGMLIYIYIYIYFSRDWIFARLFLGPS